MQLRDVQVDHLFFHFMHFGVVDDLGDDLEHEVARMRGLENGFHVLRLYQVGQLRLDVRVLHKHAFQSVGKRRCVV